MIGQKAILSTGEEVTITGYIRWGTPDHPNKLVLRYFIVAFDEEERLEEKWEPKYVTIKK